MRTETIVMFIVAGVISLAVAWQYAQSITSPEMQTVTKLRIKSDHDGPLLRGQELKEGALYENFSFEVAAGQSIIFDFALDDKAEIREAILGRRLSQSVAPGAFLESRHFFDQTPEDFVDQIEDGNQAFSFDVGAAGSLTNFIGPGSIVDVYGVVEMGDGRPEPVTLLEAVEVMAIGPISSVVDLKPEELGRFSSLTVQAKPKKIKDYLAAAARLTEIPLLVLRKPAPVQ